MQQKNCKQELKINKRGHRFLNNTTNFGVKLWITGNSYIITTHHKSQGVLSINIATQKVASCKFARLQNRKSAC